MKDSKITKGMQLIEVRGALNQALDEELARDDNVVILGEEVAEYNGAYKITKGLLDKWGDRRVRDTPISELCFSGLAVGAAMTGLRPVVEFMSWNFSFVAFDQIISNASKMHYMSGGRFNVPVVYRGPNGAAAQVSCQHSHSVEALYANFPGLIVISISNAYDAKGLLKSAIRSNNPVIFLESELGYGDKMEIPSSEYLIPIGKARIAKEGSDITLVSHGYSMTPSLQAAKELAKDGVSVEVIDLRTIKPLDVGTIVKSVQKTGRLITVEEGHSFCGLGAEIAFTVMQHCFDYLDAPAQRITQLETPMPYSKVLEAETLPNTERVLQAIKKML